MSEATSEAPSPPADPLELGREALARHAWAEAFEHLTEADRDGRLTAADLEGLATVAFFSARPDLELELRERAFKAYEADGDQVRAAYLAIDIARSYGFTGRASLASAWARRAERIVGPDGDTYAHGYLALFRSELAASRGEVDRALALAEQAVAIGMNAADADLNAYALTNLGSLKIATGATADGFALMEEASFAAVNGELSPFTSGVTACRMISACRDLTDYQRAGEWIDATERYCDRESLVAFPGVCRIHRAEVAAISGAWDRAELELERATVELEAYQAAPPQADGFYAIGDIRRLKGDFDGAQAALREAHARGRSPQPALALVRLAQGQVKAAATAIDAAVAEATWDQWARARLLPAQVEIAIATGDVERARMAIDQLTAIADGYSSPAIDAGRRVALGRVLLAEGDAEGAARELRAAIRGWREVGAPFEVARARALLARVLRTLHDGDDADLELSAALDEFRRLGARIDADAAERELREVEDRRSGPQTARMTFMFTDIVGSTTLAETLGDQAWDLLLRQHDDILRGQVAAARGEVVNSTGDGLFAAFTTARAAVDCAIAIQRALRDHRASTGFVPQVRIGLHTADANRRASDYTGKGIHVAARVAALAGADEVLATVDTLTEAGDVAASEPRETPVRGVAEPVRVAAVSWS